ncbi:hypothetical protein ACQKQA_18530, partial [Pseudomonas sp. NPDC089530]|uniref:hypothetical protein n=1 Tax=Pseudomonas sp. NPDC089530 TaxID=3390651 RepID=UPI003CFD81CB
ASGLPANLARPLKHLNQLRNKFAHNLEKELEDLDVNKYYTLVDGFVVEVGTPHGCEGPVKNAQVMSDGTPVKASDSLRVGLIVATFFLMTKAGIWLVNDLNRRGQLSLGEQLK